MAFKFVDVDRVNKAFSKTKTKRVLTEESVRDMIAETTISILDQSHITGKKDKAKKTPVSKVLKKTEDSWFLRLLYGVTVVCGIEFDAANEDVAIKNAIEFCNDLRKGKCDSKIKDAIRKSFEEKKKSLEEAKLTRMKNKKTKIAA